jgi:hypothetical protein
MLRLSMRIALGNYGSSPDAVHAGAASALSVLIRQAILPRAVCFAAQSQTNAAK